MLGQTKKLNKQVTMAMCVILAVAAVFSCVSNAFAQSSNSVRETPSLRTMNTAIIKGSENIKPIQPAEFLKSLWKNTGLNQIINGENKVEAEEEVESAVHFAESAPGWQKLIMIAVGFLIIYLAVGKGFEPLLLIPIGFGVVLVNIPGAGMGNAPDGMLHIIYKAGVGNEFFPMLIFMGIGAMTDFGPLIANPKMALLGGAAQLGVFATLLGVALMNLIPGVEYNMMQACAISIIGGADGPTSIYVAANLHRK